MFYCCSTTAEYSFLDCCLPRVPSCCHVVRIMGPTGLSDAGTDAIGFVGGGVLAICLIPQIGKIVLTRSAQDISYAWSVLYMLGLSLSLVYLILKNALAAWIPLVIEIAGCITIICLKTFFEHTIVGRKWCAARQVDTNVPADFSVRSIPGISHMASIHPDISWHGRTGSMHGSVHGSKHGVHEASAHCVEVQCGSSISQSEATQSGAGQQQEPLFPSGWQGHQAVLPLHQVSKTAPLR